MAIVVVVVVVVAILLLLLQLLLGVWVLLLVFLNLWSQLESFTVHYNFLISKPEAMINFNPLLLQPFLSDLLTIGPPKALE